MGHLNPVTRLHAAVLMASVGVLQPRRSRRRALVVATPGDMVGHGLELLSLVVTLQLCRELLRWSTARIRAHTRANQTRPQAQSLPLIGVPGSM
jgi:hypothetical protein